jgi:hypothetical protein
VIIGFRPNDAGQELGDGRDEQGRVVSPREMAGLGLDDEPGVPEQRRELGRHRGRPQADISAGRDSRWPLWHHRPRAFR